MNPKIGQGFSLGGGQGKRYGLIVNVTVDGDVEYVMVNAILEMETHVRHLSYDEANADPVADKDNVYLKSCPPPFTDLSFPGNDTARVNNAYAIATTKGDVLCPKTMSAFLFERNAVILDKGECVGPDDMRVVRYHPRVEQLQKEKDVINSVHYGNSYDKDDPSWVQKYVSDIWDAIGKYDFIFVSLRKEVRKELSARGIPFVTVAPDNTDFGPERDRILTKQQWFGRFLLRDNSHIKDFPAWLQHLMDGYDETMSLDNLTAYGAKTFFLLRHDQYLSDIMIDLHWKKETYDDIYDATKVKSCAAASA